MRLQVGTIAALSGTPQPAHFFLGEKQIKVVQIVDRWPSDDYIYFKVHADDGNTYILKHDQHIAQWQMTFFQTGNQA